MDRKIQPSIHTLENLSIAAPVRTTLPNGIPLNIIWAGEQDVVRMDIVFKSGRWYQTQLLQALFTNRMLREGTRSYTGATIAEKLDYYGSWVELSTSTKYAYITVYSLNKYLSETLEVVSSMVREATFPEKELHTVLEANIQQFKVNDTKVNVLAQRSLMKALYSEEHPCGQAAREEEYRAVTSEVLADYYRRFYHSRNCSIYLSGKVTTEVVARVREALGEQPFGECSALEADKRFTIVTASEKRIFVERPDAMQSAVKLGAITIDNTHPDIEKFKVVVTLFGGYFGSRLMSNIREEKGYTYGISAGIASFPDSGMLIVGTETDNGYVEPLIKEVYHEIDRLHEELVSEEELSLVRNYLMGEMCRSYESPFSLADAWIFVDTSGLDGGYFSRSVEAVNTITPAEIRDLAQRYLRKETLKEVIAGKKMT
ncbi:MAG: insulinase family protein [Mediterranea sp.]|jgi:predicted Zn-dependent peptidase|nr:insulinase family protein [Mediterranea sp.]